MNNNKNTGLIIGVVAACLGMLLLLLLLMNSGGGSNGTTTVAAASPSCDQASAVGGSLAGRGFTPDQYRIGQVDWSAPEANSRGSASFKTETPQTADALVAWLADGSPQSQAAFNSVSGQSGASQRALLNPRNWIPVQFVVPFELPGNTAYSNGQVNAAGVRRSGAGDVVWFFAARKNCSTRLVVIRAGCANPQSELPRPVPGPKPTPTTTRVCGTLCKGADAQPAPCVDANGVRCDGIPGSGGSPGTGGAVDHGDDGYSPSDPPPPTVVTTTPPPTTAVTLPPTTTPPTTTITAPPG